MRAKVDYRQTDVIYGRGERTCMADSRAVKHQVYLVARHAQVNRIGDYSTAAWIQHGRTRHSLRSVRMDIDHFARVGAFSGRVRCEDPWCRAGNVHHSRDRATTGNGDVDYRQPRGGAARNHEI